MMKSSLGLLFLKSEKETQRKYKNAGDNDKHNWIKTIGIFFVISDMHTKYH